MTIPTVLFEDAQLLVIHKPAGVVIHGSVPDRDEGTLVAWLAHRDPNLNTLFPPEAGQIWRPGIVHRLDQDTSGVMVVAKTPAALAKLQDQFRARTTEKIYRALVAGITHTSGEFSGAIARGDDDPTRQQIRRLSFSWSKGSSKEAETSYQRLGVNDQQRVSLVELKPKTGRMHQLRVQLADAGWPILGDERYGTKVSQQLSARLNIHHQLLHALRLSFDHPTTGKRMTFCAPYPDDILETLTRLDLPTDAC